MELTDILKSVADENRIRILNILQKKELCVCNIREILDLTQSNASRHLGKLKRSKLIKSRKSAQWVYYSINNELLRKHPFLEKLISEFKKEKKLKEDLENLEEEISCQV
ncbi:MAG: ArsR/SmtB family transcription factor [Fusobacteriota bacterium]